MGFLEAGSGRGFLDTRSTPDPCKKIHHFFASAGNYSTWELLCKVLLHFRGVGYRTASTVLMFVTPRGPLLLWPVAANIYIILLYMHASHFVTVLVSFRNALKGFRDNCLGQDECRL